MIEPTPNSEHTPKTGSELVHPKEIQNKSPVQSTLITQQPNLRTITVSDQLEGNFTIRYTPRNVVVLGNNTDH